MKIRKMLKSDRYINAASKKENVARKNTWWFWDFSLVSILYLFVLGNGRKKSKGRYTNSEIVQELCFSVCFGVCVLICLFVLSSARA